MFTQFERDESADTGVMFRDFVIAVGMFVYTNEGARKVFVPDVAMAFNTSLELVREAVKEHPWLYLHPTGQIESDGE